MVHHSFIIALNRFRGRACTWSTAAPAIPAVLLLLLGISVSAAGFTSDTLPARGEHQVLLAVDTFGRYAVTATSQQGVALQLVDHMAGPRPVAGQPGRIDGRYDIFLDRGEYKLVTIGHDLARGDVELSLHEFPEQQPDPIVLEEFKPITTKLDDFEQLSFWLEIRQPRSVVIQAAGRALADVRIWRDGTWMTDDQPVHETIQPTENQPLHLCTMVASLTPGLYRLTCYGGLPLPWATGVESPLFVRYGLERRGEAGRETRTMSPFGIDYYLLPGDINYCRLELPEAVPASFTVAVYNDQAPFDGWGDTASIDKNSREPVAEVFPYRDPGSRFLVSIKAAAGQPYILQHFYARHYEMLQKSGMYWLSTIHGGHPADSLDASAILVKRRVQGDPRPEFVDHGAVVVDSTTYWQGRFNLLDETELFLKIGRSGTYKILSNGVSARFRLAPFLVDPPREYQPPPFEPAGNPLDLEAGLYRLVIMPDRKGIAELAVVPVSLGGFDWQAALQPEYTRAPFHGSVELPAVSLDTQHRYELYINNRPGIQSGFILRPLPVDLRESLPLVQHPGEIKSLPFSVNETCMLHALPERDAGIELRIDGGEWLNEATVTSGPHVVEIRCSDTVTTVYSLSATPTRLLAGSPLPRLPGGRLEALPKFPVLAADSPRFFDLEPGYSQSFSLRVDEPGLWRVHSTGLLATAGVIRTRTEPYLAGESANGVGLNFMVQHYLNEGDYQVSVNTIGNARGHLGVELSTTPLRSCGELLQGEPARVTLEPGEAALYTFTTETAAEYSIRSLGQDAQVFRCRLEDGAGWPVTVPNQPADLRLHLEAGEYRLIILPVSVTARAVTELARVPEPTRLKGHGPYEIIAGRSLDALWREPAEGSRRLSDQWLFTAPASAVYSIRMSSEMEGLLYRVLSDGTRTMVAEVNATKGWRGELEAGAYLVEAVCSRRNDWAAYTFSLDCEALVDGATRELRAPVSIPVALGESGLVELASRGRADVSARLLDMSGRQVAASDDRPDDWNFLITRWLGPGRYTLRIDTPGGEPAVVTVGMRVVRETIMDPGMVPVDTTVVVHDKVHVIPLEKLSDGVLLVSATAGESVGCTLEMNVAGEWRALQTGRGRSVLLEMLVQEGAMCRLRLWSIDWRHAEVMLHCLAPACRTYSEANLARGVTFEAVPGFSPPVGVARIAVDRPGVFVSAAGHESVRWSPAPGRPFASGSGVMTASGAHLWIAADLAAGGAHRTIRASRRVVAPGESVNVPLVPGETVLVDVAPAAGPLVAEARSLTGLPGLRFISPGEQSPYGPDARAMALDTRTAVTVTAEPSRALCIWCAAGEEPFETRLALTECSAPEVVRLDLGRRGGLLAAGGAVRFELTKGARLLDIAAGPDVIAVTIVDGRIESMLWNAGGAGGGRLWTEARDLLLVATSDAPRSYAVNALPAGEAERPLLSMRTPYEHVHATAGRLVIPYEAPADTDSMLAVLGAARSARTYGDDGTVGSGTELTVRGSGLLVLDHAPGAVVAWLSAAADPDGGLWSVDTGRGDAIRDLPALVPLKGETASFRLKLDTPGLLALNAPVPAVVRLTGDGFSSLEVATGGVMMRSYVPAGRLAVQLRAVAGGRLSGDLELSMAPVTSIGEGIGPEVMLSPGSSHAFSFEVPETMEIGIGVRAGPPAVTCWLLNADGDQVGEGILQMHELAAGRYVLAVTAARDGGPVLVRPALTGLTPPDTGPPREIIQQYLELAGRN
ncbi:hypothetical protein JW905_16380 [bacterium]|nr:hypothetical protein [candidate division CSSED10-310 bacterium]